MTPRSLTGRILRGTVFVALVTALAGAATASVIARGLWRAHERRALLELGAGLAQAMAREAREEGTAPDAAAAEALRESVAAGRRAEVWRGATLVAAVPPGPVLGPPDAAAGAGADRPVRRSGWIVEESGLPGGLRLLVAAPEERIAEVLRVLLWSLVLSAPVCLVLAIAIGRLVGRRAARPLLEFRDRIAAARPFDALPAAAPASLLEVRDLETSFRALWERLREAAGREAEFAGNAAHELRTPLTRIRLRAEEARAAARGATRPLDDLIAEIDRTARLVDSLLVLARDPAAGIPAGEAVNLSDVVAEAARRVFAGGAAPRLQAPDEALVRGDQDLLAIAVQNLLDNARKFSGPGAGPRVEVENAGGLVRLSVTTPGARVAAADRERLFERFYRGPEARAALAGHGLGLPLARHVARLHRGEVRLASDSSEDARFEMTLPAWCPAESPRAGAVGQATGRGPEAAPGPAPAPRGDRVVAAVPRSTS